MSKQTITPTLTKPISFDEFVAWYPENAACKYEGYTGRIVEMPLGTGVHSNMTGFISLKLGMQMEHHEFPNHLWEQRHTFKQSRVSISEELGGYHTSGNVS